MEGLGTRGPSVVYRKDTETVVEPQGSKEFRMPIDPVVSLKPDTIYTVRVHISGNSGSYRGDGFLSPVLAPSGLAVTFHPSTFDGEDRPHSNSSTCGPITALFLVPRNSGKSYELGQASADIVPQLGGEFKLKRFRGASEAWHINSDSQVESFAFVVTKAVIATAIGVGCPVSRRSQVRIKSLQIVLGTSTTGPVGYTAESETMIACGDWDKKVARVPLTRPVRLEANVAYTLRMTIRGDSKVFKGTGLLPGPLSMEDGGTLSVMRSEYAQSEVRNGDNETSGPIFYISYLIPHLNSSLEDAKKLELKLFPVDFKPKSEEIKIQRFERFGRKWYVKEDGKQVEAITFAIDKAVYLTAIGLGNAAKPGQKATVLGLKVLQGRSTASPPVYTHSQKEKLTNTGDDTLVVKLQLSHRVAIEPEKYYTVRVQYKPGARVAEGKEATNDHEEAGIQFHFEGTEFEDGDDENGSHEAYGPLIDFYFVEKTD